MKRFALLIVLIILVGAVPSSVWAQAYTDDENSITVEIPDGSSVYYYTPEGTNMFEDLLEQVQSSGRDVRLLIRSYAPDYLGWSMEVTASPLDGEPAASAGQDPQTQDDAIAAPSPRTDARPLEFTDITAESETKREEYVELVRSAYQGRFNFSNPKLSTLNGVSALELDGTGVVDSIWGPYDTTVYLVTNEDRLLTISLVYQRSEGDTFEKEAMAALSTLAFGDVPLPTQTPAATTAAPPSPSPSPKSTVIEAAPPSPSAPTTAKEFFQDFWHNIQKKFAAYPNLIYYVMIAVAVILLVVALIIHLRNTKKRKAWALEEDDDWGLVETRFSSDSQDHQVQPAPSEPRKLQRIEDRNMISEQPSRHLRQGHDYTEDISRYTQQPGPEVNDVSRFTHGYDDDVDDELKKLQDQSFVEPKPVKVQSVGSRVERNRRRRGK